jgi:hypothetical protein
MRVVCTFLGAVVAVVCFQSQEDQPQAQSPAVSRVEFKGWKNNLRLFNGDAELIVTLDVGPRIMSYRLRNSENVFKEYADQLGKSEEKDWQIRGGHRLWVAPEDLTRTYALDNASVTHEFANGWAKFRAPADSLHGIQKEVDVRLAPSGSRVTVKHRITNIRKEPTTLSVWAVSVMAPGGIEIIPLPPHKPHPGSPRNARSPKDFAPNLEMALWPYFDFRDDRWNFGGRYLTLRQKTRGEPTKLGLAHRMGWVAYLNRGTLFVKRFGYHEGKTYPDLGSNFETFTNPDMLEIETLGPLATLAAGETAEHVEEWELIPEVEDFRTEAGIDVNILPKVVRD